jgi:chromosomal replication initiator protein
MVEVRTAFRALLAGASWMELRIPPPEEREELVRQLGRRHDLDLNSAAAQYLAVHHGSSLHELSGAIGSLAAYASLKGRGATGLDFAREALAATSRSRRRAPCLAEVRRAVAEACSVSVEDMVGSSRRRAVCTARQVAMYLAREMTEASLSEIGRAFGGRTHSTVKHAVDKVRDLTGSDPQTAELLERCRAAL